MNRALKNIFSFEKNNNYPIFIISIIGFVLRVAGAIHFVHDGTVHTDARVAIQSAIRYSHGIFHIPHIPTYPLAEYLFGLWFAVVQFVSIIIKLTQSVQGFQFGILPLTSAAIILCVFIGSFSIFLVYKIGARLRDNSTGLWAGILFALSPIHIFNCHMPYNDTIVTFFVLCVVLAALEIVRNGVSWQRLVSGGILWGLATLAKPVGILAGIPFLIACVSSRKTRDTHNFWLIPGRIVFVILIYLMTYLIFCPYFIKDHNFLIAQWYSRYIDQMAGALELRTSLAVWREIGWFVEARILLESYGGLVLAITITGLACLFVHPNLSVWLVLSFPIIFFFFLGLDRYIDLRYMDSLSPFIAIFGAEAIMRIPALIHLPRRLYPYLRTTFVFLLLTPLLLLSLETAYLFRQEDTRTIAGNWIINNILPTQRIAIGYRLYMPEFPHRDFRLTYDEFSSLEGAQEKTDIWITSSLLTDRAPWSVNKIYEELAAEFRPIKDFNLRPLNFIQPRIRIYKMDEKVPHEFSAFVLPMLPDPGPGIYPVFPSPFVYGKDKLQGNVGETRFLRTIVTHKPLHKIYFRFSNGIGANRLHICAGRLSTSLELRPLEEKWIEVKPKRNFPYFAYVYKIRVSSEKRRKCHVTAFTNPSRAAWQAVFTKGAQIPISFANKKPGRDPDAHLLLALAYARMNDMIGALGEWKRYLQLRPLEIHKDIVSSLVDTRFYEGTQEFRYSGDFLPYISHGKGMRLPLPSLVFHDPKIHEPGYILFGPYINLEPGIYELRIAFRVHSNTEEEPWGFAEVIDYPEKILARRELQGGVDTLKPTIISLPFSIVSPQQELEFRFWAADAEVEVIDLAVRPKAEESYRYGICTILRELALFFAKHEEISNALAASETASSFTSRPQPRIWLVQMAETLLKVGYAEKALPFAQEAVKKEGIHIRSLEVLAQCLQQKGEDASQYHDRMAEIKLPSGGSAVFAERYELIGTIIDSKTYSKGDYIRLRQYWKALGPVRRCVAAFIHFKGESCIFQGDYEPKDKRRMFHTLDEGEIIVCKRDILVPPDILPGVYEILTGLWDPYHQHHIRITEIVTELPAENGAVKVGEVVIGK